MFPVRLGCCLVVLAVLSSCGSGGGGGGGGGGGSGGTVVLEGDLTSDGGSLTLNGVTVSVPPDGVVSTVHVRVSRKSAPGGLPSAYTATSNAFDVTVDHSERLDLPLQITLPYDDALASEDHIVVLHQLGPQSFEPVSLRAVDRVSNVATFETRSFSSFIVTSLASAFVPTSYGVPNFVPSLDGWNIPNFGNYFAPGGNCLGMASYCTYFFDNHPTENLAFKFSAVNFPTPGDPSIAQLVAGRAHLAQSQWWALMPSFLLQQTLLGDAEIGLLMKASMSLFDTPLVLVMTGSPGGHACVLFGYDSDEFFFYDVNFPSATQSLPFDGTSFGTYGGFDAFGFVMLPSLGRLQDFDGLTAEGESGFTSSQDIFLSNPQAGAQISTHDVPVTGVLSGSLSSATELRAFVKGVEYCVPVVNHTFQRTLPVSAGQNTLILMAGVNIAQQSLWFSNGATLIRQFEGTFPNSELLVTLTWDQNNTDVDLYVTQPDGQTAWFADHQTSHQLTLDFDDTTGFGPEHITLTPSTGGVVLPGNYAIRVHYYSDHGTGQVASGHVTVVVNENQQQQVFAQVPFVIGPNNPSNSFPGSTGPDWFEVGLANLQAGTFTPAN
jgi:hypothetical protein